MDDSLFLGTWTDKQSSIPYHNVFDAGLDFIVLTQSAEWHAGNWLWNPGVSPAVLASIVFIVAIETSRNIAARVIERDTSGEIYYFLEDSRGFRTRQQRQNGRQITQLQSSSSAFPGTFVCSTGITCATTLFNVTLHIVPVEALTNFL
ncbi:hypothetical protein TNCV_1177131 [Trichonephila clavipes]|nr:hypothetical protein TNCV_1177131 [Trichonephila clavipes]